MNFPSLKYEKKPSLADLTSVWQYATVDHPDFSREADDGGVFDRGYSCYQPIQEVGIWKELHGNKGTEITTRSKLHCSDRFVKLTINSKLLY